MNVKELVRQARDFAEPYCIRHGKQFRLKSIDPADTADLSKERAAESLKRGLKMLAALQEKLYAQNNWALLLIFQAMDAAGKDSIIKHVMSGVDPQGCQVFSFKAPSTQELDHDFLWRTTLCLPERGRIGIFNRSYYEEVLVVRVHREILREERLPPRLVTKDIWKKRFEDIGNFERYLSHNGVVICKFFLHVSKTEQKKRFLRRLELREKNWKFSLADVRDRKHWSDYMKAYEAMVQQTASEYAPWYVVPADNKWFSRLVVAAAVIDTLWSLDLRFPRLGKDKLRSLRLQRGHCSRNSYNDVTHLELPRTGGLAIGMNHDSGRCQQPVWPI
jgi:PPK2 family polyphosphate:nucleotide phosphotransferase